MVFEKWQYRHISRSPRIFVIFEIASVKPVILLYIVSYFCYDNRQLRVHILVICLVKHCGKVSCVRPLVLVQQPDFHHTHFSEISFWELSLKFVKSYRLLLKSDKNNRQCCTHSLELLWIKDRPVAETSSRQHTTFTRDRDPCTSRVLYPTFPANERS